MDKIGRGAGSRMTRRNFVTGTALASAAAVVAGMAGCAPKSGSDTGGAKADVMLSAPA